MQRTLNALERGVQIELLRLCAMADQWRQTVNPNVTRFPPRTLTSQKCQSVCRTGDDRRGVGLRRNAASVAVCQTVNGFCYEDDLILFVAARRKRFRLTVDCGCRCYNAQTITQKKSNIHSNITMCCAVKHCWTTV